MTHFAKVHTTILQILFPGGRTGESRNLCEKEFIRERQT